MLKILAAVLFLGLLVGCSSKTGLDGELSIYLKEPSNESLTLDVIKDDAVIMGPSSSITFTPNQTKLIVSDYGQFKNGDGIYYLKYELCTQEDDKGKNAILCDKKYYTVTKQGRNVSFNDLGCQDCKEQLGIIKSMNWTTK